MEIFNKARKIVLCRNAEVAESFGSRLLGLMFRRDFEGCLVIHAKYSCSIHTFFMFFPIDVVFLDKNFVVCDFVTLKPWRFYSPKRSCKYIIESKEGKLKGKVDIGDELEFIFPVAYNTPTKGIRKLS